MIETWRVNSYGYPNPFQDNANSRQAWDTFVSFAEHTSYREVKDFWFNSSRNLKPSGVESWKSAFEQFGQLYVLKRSDDIVITPGGFQQIRSAETDDLEEFCWVGTNLLLRYPLSGKPGRRSRGAKHDSSDLLPYWYLLACMLDNEGLWQSEFYHIATAFSVADAREKSAFIPVVRGDPSRSNELANFNEEIGDAVYNALNQVLVQGGLNHCLFSSERLDSPYGRRENWWHIESEHRKLLEAAVGGQISTGCAAISGFVDRMPSARPPLDELGYFEYMGAEVAPRRQPTMTGPVLRSTTIDGEYVPLLRSGEDFVRIDVRWIEGKVSSLCTLAPGMRVIFDDDLTRTYIVENKSLTGVDVKVELRPAKKIANPKHVAKRFQEPVA
jgi:hypothetical protein